MTPRDDWRWSNHPDAIAYAEEVAERRAEEFEQDPFGWEADRAAAREYGYTTPAVALSVVGIAACLAFFAAFVAALAGSAVAR
jgi:hypothetical protein